ncbi:MAG: hypothetical protein ACJA2O_004146 [Candidatus Azotimanducaceae bacterium]|jgi:hypothetical protein
MNIFSKRDKNGRFQGGKESESVIEDESKTVSAPSESVSTDDSTNTITIPETKMNKARIVFNKMFGKDGIARKDIISAFQSDKVKLTKAG